jgi:hypothetical protein
VVKKSIDSSAPHTGARACPAGSRERGRGHGGVAWHGLRCRAGSESAAGVRVGKHCASGWCHERLQFTPHISCIKLEKK